MLLGAANQKYGFQVGMLTAFNRADEHLVEARRNKGQGHPVDSGFENFSPFAGSHFNICKCSDHLVERVREPIKKLLMVICLFGILLTYGLFNPVVQSATNVQCIEKTKNGPGEIFSCDAALVFFWEKSDVKPGERLGDLSSE